MAKSMKWKEGWGESPKKKQAQKNLEQAAQKTAERRNAIKSGNDIALKNVNTAPNKIKRGLGSLATGAAASVPKMLGNTQVNNVKFQNPLLPAEKQQAVAAEMRQRNAKDIQGIRNAGQNMFNLKGTKGEEIAYGLGEAIAPIMLPGGMVGKAGKTIFATEGLSKLGTLAARGRQGAAIGLGYTGAAEEKPTAKDYAENAALFGAFDVGAAGLGMAGKSLLGKIKKPKVEVKTENPKVDDLDEAEDFFDIEGVRGTDFTADQFGNVRRGEALEALPAGEQRLMLQAGQTPKALTGQQPLMLPEGKIPNWENYQPTRFQATPDGKVMDMQEGAFPLAKVDGIDYTADTGLGNRQRIAQDTSRVVPRSDIGDPAYISSLEKQYNEMVDAELAHVKANSKLGVEQGGLGFSDEGEVVNRWGRMSNNPQWYRDIYTQNATEASPFGKEPRAGQYRDQAIKNLIEGNADTGEPASAQFHAILSELSRGQKLPDEWHGLQKSIRELENAKEEYIPKENVGLDTKEPWQMTKDEFIANTPKGYKYTSSLGETLGRYDTDGKIILTDAFFGHNSEIKKEIWAHEKAHGVVKDITNSNYFWDLVDSGLFGKYNEGKMKFEGIRGGRNVDEVLTQLVADLETGVPLKIQDEFAVQYNIARQIRNGETPNIENAIKQTLSEGKSISPEVLKNYPNLKADNGITSLLSDMKAAQKQVEPYGLNKNLDRLTELENQARQRMKDRADFRKQYPDAIGIVAKNPLDDIKDLTIIGATKIAKGTIEFAQWSKEMIDEFGQIIEKQLPGIWKHSNILAQKGETTLKYKDYEMPVKWQADNAAPKAGKLPGLTNGQAKPKNATTGAGEAKAVNDMPKQIAALKNHINNAKKATKYDGNEPARAARVAELEGQLRDLMKTAAKSNKTGYNDISGFQAETQDVARNFKDFYGKDIELQEGSILDNLNTAKGSNIDYQKNWTDKLKSEVVDKLGISKNTKLSKLVQQYGEGEITLEQLKFMRPKDWQKVVEADNWFRKSYDEILTDVNKTIEQIYPGQADKLVPKRSDYYRHFRDLEGFQGFKNMMGSPANISPELAGRSEFVKPNTKWASFKQQRGLGEFKRDAVGGFLDYLPAASYSVNIDPMVGQFRGLSDQLVKETSGEANTMIRYLQDYANSLAGKTSGWDRKVQELLEGKGGSRLAMNTITWLNNRAKANSVLLNPGSALSQVLNIPNGVAFTKQYSIPGTGKALLSIFKEDAARASSAFMKERFSGQMYRQFDTKWFDQPKNFAAWMIETADRVGTEMIWQSCHSKGLKTKGIADPVKYADAMTKRLVAGRGIGEMALIQKSKLFQVVAPFQVEVGNLWKVQKDFIKEKDFSAIATLYVGLWLANNMMESVRGQRIVFDPINAIMEATQEIADPENDAKEKAYKAGGRLAGEILGNVPLGQTMAAAYPEYGNSAKGIPTRKELFGSEDPTRYGTGPLIVKAVQNPLKYLALPFGGAQADKVWQAANTLHSGGSYKNDKLRYPVNVDAESVSKGLLFGPSAMDETKEYYNKNRRPLSENQTKEYQTMVRNGMTPEKAYESIMKAREDRSNKKTTATQKTAATKWKEGW